MRKLPRELRLMISGNDVYWFDIQTHFSMVNPAFDFSQRDLDLESISTKMLMFYHCLFCRSCGFSSCLEGWVFVAPFLQGPHSISAPSHNYRSWTPTCVACILIWFLRNQKKKKSCFQQWRLNTGSNHIGPWLVFLLFCTFLSIKIKLDLQLCSCSWKWKKLYKLGMFWVILILFVISTISICKQIYL